MRALVVYDSVYGNTEKIARAIADGLAVAGEVKLRRASEANASDLEGIDLLIVGAPTQGGRATKVVQEFLGKIAANGLKDVSVAAFDTRMKHVVAQLLGYAAGRIADSLKKKGGRLATAPQGFFVTGSEGPLKEGEIERATAWGQSILAGKKVG